MVLMATVVVVLAGMELMVAVVLVMKTAIICW